MIPRGQTRSVSDLAPGSKRSPLCVRPRSGDLVPARAARRPSHRSDRLIHAGPAVAAGTAAPAQTKRLMYTARPLRSRSAEGRPRCAQVRRSQPRCVGARVAPTPCLARAPSLILRRHRARSRAAEGRGKRVLLRFPSAMRCCPFARGGSHRPRSGDPRCDEIAGGGPSPSLHAGEDLPFLGGSVKFPTITIG